LDPDQPTAVKSGHPGGPAVVVGDPADPVPTPVCVATTFGSASRPNGGVTLDAFHRAVSWSDAGGNWQIKLDDEAQFTAIQSPTGEQATITYDETGNVVGLQLPDGTLDAFKYDERDSLAEAHWGSNLVAQYEYDDRGDLPRATLQQAGGAMSSAQYWFDGLHRIRRMERYPHWPDLADTRRIDFGYGSDGTGSAASA
jgi:YD repeat-containing protein